MQSIPITRLRKHSARGQQEPEVERIALPIRLTAAILGTAVTAWLAVTFPWAWKWLCSGTAILSLLIIYHHARGALAFHSTPPWITLASLNLIYAIMSTSWLQYRLFTAICWPCVITNFLLISPSASNIARAIFRRLLTQAHFTKDEIAGFNVPALHLDIGLEGLLTIRGWTFSLSTLTMEVHGIEAAHNLTEELHIALYCDNVVVRLCRGVKIGAIHGVLKREKFVVELGNLSCPRTENNANFGTSEQPLQSTNHAFDNEDGLKIVVNNPQNNTAFHKAIDPAKAKTSGDSRAESDYDNIRRELFSTSPIHQCRAQAEDQPSPQVEQKVRAATCEKLENSLSVPHRSKRSIKASTILDFVPIWIQRLFSRMPFLLRLVLMPLSYLHPTKIASTSVSASGSWMLGIMQERVYSFYGEDRDGIERLEQTMSNWMNNAYFCVDLSNIQIVVQVSARASQDIVGYLRCASSMLMRIEPRTKKVAPAISVDGADATLTIPAFFLPSHEHMVPSKPTSKADRQPSKTIEKPYGQISGTSAADHESSLEEEEEEDCAEIGISAHLSFPALLDRSMVDFFADLIESTIMMGIDDHEAGDHDDESSSMDKTTMSRAKTKVKVVAHDMTKSVKKGMKKAAFSTRGDTGIPKIVNKISKQLEALHGDVGYSGSIPVPLGPYRGSSSLPTKLIA